MITGVFTVMICLAIFAFLKFVYHEQRDKLLSRRTGKNTGSNSVPIIRVIGRIHLAEDGENGEGVHKRLFPGAETQSLN